MIDKLNENTSTKFRVKDFDEAKSIIAELQQEIKEKLKEKVEKKRIQPELRSRIKEFIDIDKWGPQIDYTINVSKKEQKNGSEDETFENVLAGNSEEDSGNDDGKLMALDNRVRDLENRVKAHDDRINKICNIISKIIHSIKNIKYKKRENTEEADNLHEEAKALSNGDSKILIPSDTDKKTETIIVDCLELEIIDTKETIERKIDNWMEKLNSSAQYPYLKGGRGIKAIANELGETLEYDSGHELDNMIIKKIYHILQLNFEYKEVECIGDYALRDYFIEEIKNDIDENITTRKAMILEDKYAENPLIIKGHVIIPDNSVSHEERKFESDEQCVDSQSQDYL